MLNRRCANEYNSLADVHLQAYFSNRHLLRHLRQAGLINKKREIVPETTYRANINRAEQKREVKEALAQAIVHKSLDLQLKRESEIQKRLEEIAKLEMVKKMRSERQLRKPPMTPSSRASSSQHPAWKYFTVYPNKQDSFPSSRPRTAHTRQNVQDSPSVTSGESGSYIDSYSDSTTTSVPESDSQIRHARGDAGSSGYQRKPGRFPPKKHGPHFKKDDREELKTSPYLDTVPSTEKRLFKIFDLPSGARKTYHPPDSMVNKRTNCLVTLMYLGTNTYVSWDEPNPGTEVVIHQQHCGGNTVCVYRNQHMAREEFSFVSHRHLNFPFSLSIYLSGILYLRVSACCEYRHRKGTRLGGPQGLFSLINVQGASPCARCLIYRKMNEEKKKKLRINSSKAFEDGVKVEPTVSTCLIEETESIQENKEESEKENNAKETEDKDDLTQSEEKEAQHEPIQFTVSGTVINVEDSNSEEEDDYQEDFEDEAEQKKDGGESDDKEKEVEEVVEVTEVEEVEDVSDETSSTESEEVPSEKAEEVEEETEDRKEEEALEVVEIKEAMDSDSDETSSTKSEEKVLTLEDDDYEDDFHKDDEAEEKNKEADTETEANDQNPTLESSSLDKDEKEKDNESTNPEDSAENVEEKTDKESVKDLKNEEKEEDTNSVPTQEKTHKESDSDARSESSSSKEESSSSSAPPLNHRKKSKVKPERRIRANNRKTTVPGSSSSDSDSIAHLPAELEGTEKAKNWIPAREQQTI